MNSEDANESPLPPHLDPRQPAHQRRSARLATERRRMTLLQNSARGIAAVLSVIVLVASGYAFALITRATAITQTRPSVQGIDGNHDGDGINGKDLNILMVGVDTQGTSTSDELGADTAGSLNTDTMMLIHVPASGAKASIVSFPRDSYVTIPGFGKKKLNAAYPNGYWSLEEGATTDQRIAAAQELLVKTISGMTGVGIDHFVEVTLDGFYKLTEAVGGIEVNLCQDIDDQGYTGLDLKAGKHILDPKTAMLFVRQRHNLEGGDLGRIKRQQYFFGAMIRKVLDQGLLDIFNGKLINIIDALGETISYDKDLNPIELATQMHDIAAGNVEFRTIPLAAEPYASIPGAGDVVLTAEPQQLKDFFKQLSMGSSSSKSSAPTTSEAPATVAPSEVTLDVYNGVGIPGTASKVAEELKAQGFVVENLLSASTSDYQESVVQYPPGMEKEANTLAAAVPGAILEETSSIEGKVLLIVGANYPGLQIATPEPTTTTAPAPTTSEPPKTAADEGCVY